MRRYVNELLFEGISSKRGSIPSDAIAVDHLDVFYGAYLFDVMTLSFLSLKSCRVWLWNDQQPFEALRWASFDDPPSMILLRWASFDDPPSIRSLQRAAIAVDHSEAIQSDSKWFKVILERYRVWLWNDQQQFEGIPSKRSNRRDPIEEIPSKASHRRDPIEEIHSKTSHRRHPIEEVPSKRFHGPTWSDRSLWIAVKSNGGWSLWSDSTWFKVILEKVSSLTPK